MESENGGSISPGAHSLEQPLAVIAGHVQGRRRRPRVPKALILPRATLVAPRAGKRRRETPGVDDEGHRLRGGAYARVDVVGSHARPQGEARVFQPPPAAPAPAARGAARCL